MSTEAVRQVGGIFPKGTKVIAVPRTSDFYNGGPEHAKATVDKDTNVTFTGLVENGPYWLVGEVEHEDADGKKVKETIALSFTAHDEETRSLSPDEAATQTATRLVAEKASAGALAVRDGNEALAVDPAGSPDERHVGIHGGAAPVAPKDSPTVAAEIEQSEATQAARGVDKLGDRVGGPAPKGDKADEGPSSAKTVKGARSTTNAKRTRSKTRGAEGAKAKKSPRPRARAARKSPAKGRTKK